MTQENSIYNTTKKNNTVDIYLTKETQTYIENYKLSLKEVKKYRHKQKNIHIQGLEGNIFKMKTLPIYNIQP